MADQTPAEELRELIREAHGLLKDMRRERREIEQLLDGIPARVDQRIEAAVKADLETLAATTKTAMDTAVAKVFAEFDRLKQLFTGTAPVQRRRGKQPLDLLIKEARDQP